MNIAVNLADTVDPKDPEGAPIARSTRHAA
jgi:hypothetical protein